VDNKLQNTQHDNKTLVGISWSMTFDVLKCCCVSLCAEAANCLSRTVAFTPLVGVKAGSRAALTSFPAAYAPHQCLHRLLSIPNLQLLANETRKAFSMSWKMQLNERVLAGNGNGESLGTARGKRGFRPLTL
jgi:hypothetical protein